MNRTINYDGVDLNRYWEGMWQNVSSRDRERRTRADLVIITRENERKGLNSVLDLGRYRSLHKLLRVTAFFSRFIQNLSNIEENTVIQNSPTNPGS